MIRRVSLTTRLTICYALIAASLLLGMTWMIAGMVSQHFWELDKETLQDKLSLVEGIVMRSQTSGDIAPRLGDALQNHPGLFVRVGKLNSDEVAFQSADFRFPPRMLEAKQSLAGDSLFTWQTSGQEFRALTREVQWNDASQTTWLIAAAVDTQHHDHFVVSLKRSLLTYAILASILSAVLSWWAARTGLKPLRAMKSRAQAVNANKLDERMPAESVPIEMADLATSLNDMLQRLQNDFRRLSEFSSDLAHELRTPISNLLTQTQVVLAQHRTVEEYQDTLASNAEEFQRLARMVSDMLLLAKAEHGLLLPSTEEIELQKEVLALLDFYEALSEEKSVKLHCSGEGRILGDRLMLRRAISNLLSNALKYTPASGTVEISIESTPDHVCLRVTNTGAAISAEHLPRLFDRFYRADKARTHAESDGAGLGLAITRAIVEAHGGKAGVKSFDGKTMFELNFKPMG
jgi:two-component system heavy metal sensor histidine kinase CusS